MSKFISALGIFQVLMSYFSPELICRLQKHFHERFGLAVTSSQAEEYLHSFADVFLLFASSSEDPPFAGSAGLSRSR